MLKAIVKLVSENIYLFLGIVIGLYVSSMVTTSVDISCVTTENTLKENFKFAQEIINSSINRLAPRILPEKPKGETKSAFVRPRYYSTELGIREKLFVGIFTSEDKVNTQATHINKTIGHIVDKIKFFITAQYKLKAKFNLTGLVGFTDARSKYRPFQVIKYVADTFAQDYDFYFFASDYTFINVHRLKDIVDKISGSMDVYLGTRVTDSGFCNLDAGIILSNSVLMAARKTLEWCIMNAVSEDYSENLGRCIYQSLGLYCQEAVQGQSMVSYKLKHFDLPTHLKELSDLDYFNKAVTVRPVISNNDFFRLDAYFLKQRLEMYNKQILKLSKPFSESWPPGLRSGAKPATRFDLPRQYYFNMTHVFLADDFTIVRRHTESELWDIQIILKDVTARNSNQFSRSLVFRRLINGYKTFDLSRGLEYVLDLGFRDKNTGKEIVRRFEVCKPLGNVEFVQAPYVMENTRISIILPIQISEAFQALNFLEYYSSNIMDKKETTFLLMAFMYQYESDSKGSNDVFSKLKEFAKNASARFKHDDVKIAWLSIRLPDARFPLNLEEQKSLNFAVVDLSLKKIGLDSLTLVLDVWSNITVDFMNRVRMNTIEGYQIFSPIPFRQYNPYISQVQELDVNKMSGHFDREEYKYISFYGRDYVTARKIIQNSIPLVKVDNDITKLLGDGVDNVGNIFDMFIQKSEDLHCMRATEMNLKVLYHFEKDEHRINRFYGNDVELAKLLLTKHESIPELI